MRSKGISRQDPAEPCNHLLHVGVTHSRSFSERFCVPGSRGRGRRPGAARSEHPVNWRKALAQQPLYLVLYFCAPVRRVSQNHRPSGIGRDRVLPPALGLGRGRQISCRSTFSSFLSSWNFSCSHFLVSLPPLLLRMRTLFCQQLEEFPPGSRCKDENL